MASPLVRYNYTKSDRSLRPPASRRGRPGRLALVLAVFASLALGACDTQPAPPPVKVRPARVLAIGDSFTCRSAANTTRGGWEYKFRAILPGSTTLCRSGQGPNHEPDVWREEVRAWVARNGTPDVFVLESAGNQYPGIFTDYVWPQGAGVEWDSETLQIIKAANPRYGALLVTGARSAGDTAYRKKRNRAMEEVSKSFTRLAASKKAGVPIVHWDSETLFRSQGSSKWSSDRFHPSHKAGDDLGTVMAELVRGNGWKPL